VERSPQKQDADMADDGEKLKTEVSRMEMPSMSLSEEDSMLRLHVDELAGWGSVRPASKSMHESSLHKPNQWMLPEIRGLDAVRRALEGDARTQSRKYGNVSEPRSDSARFHVELPRSPQHLKYSRATTPRVPSRMQGEADQSKPGSPNPPSPYEAGSSPIEEDGENIPQSLRFSKWTLQKWFREIDKDGTGFITQREFIVRLRQQPGLLDFFLRLKSHGGHCGHVAKAVQMWRGKDSVHRLQAVRQARQDIYMIKEILREVDKDGSGTMEWGEFVDFFRRSGLLLEYATRDNKVALCEEEEQRKAREAEQLDQYVSASRTARFSNHR
jgi:Ca2+-binding EF-hand superfamily protein